MAARTPVDTPELAEYAPVALLELTREDEVRNVNPAAETLFGLSRRGLIGRPLVETLANGESLIELLDYARQTQADVAAPDLVLKPVGLAAAKRLTARVRYLGNAGTVVSLTVPLSQEREEGIPGVAGFGRILGHEIKNPLAGISGAAQLLLRKGRSDDREMLMLIRDESARIERLVNRLTAFELFSAPRFEALNIHRVLDRVLASEEAAYDGEVAFRRRYDPSLPDIEADSDHLHEAFQNIVRNGAEAALSGGRAERPEITVITAFETGFGQKSPDSQGPLRRAIRVDIQDNGPGVAVDRLASVFEAFASSKSGGRGLGLTIVKEVVSAHSGYVRLDNHGGGTRVSVFLPIGARGE
ncbi:MAG: PAS domain S-box protein [Alphaproteobacteria bacterium]|jgi:two-component system nitrogen regulation sensor histidine kinase GlnL|nr:PAS domain S-box protein [Alphaproteobacteria bacterium]